MSQPSQPESAALAYVGLGGNLGDRAGTLAAALGRLRELGRVGPVSPVYETEPFAVAGPQPKYLNQVCGLETALSAVELVRALLAIEAQLGRAAHEKNDPRVIDLDLLLLGTEVIDEPGVQVPHPRLHERAFVLVPLADIAPGLLHPRLGLTAREMLAAVDATGVRRLSAS